MFENHCLLAHLPLAAIFRHPLLDLSLQLLLEALSLVRNRSLVALAEASTSTPPLDLLIPPRAVDAQLHLGGNGESKAVGHPLEIQFVNIEDVFQRVGRIGLEVGAVPVSRRAVEVVIFVDKLLELGLDVGDLVDGKVVLVEGNLGLLQVAEETELGGEEEEEGATFLSGPGGSSHAVNVLPGVIGGIVLDNPVNSGDIEATCGDVSAKQDTALGVDELEEGVGPLLLLLLSLE